MIEYAALAYLNSKLLRPYGRATSLVLDSARGTVRITLELKGEAVPVELEVTDYQIAESGGRYFAVVKAVHTSREWLTALARDQLCNRQIELGPKAGRALMKLMLGRADQDPTSASD